MFPLLEDSTASCSYLLQVKYLSPFLYFLDLFWLFTHQDMNPWSSVTNALNSRDSHLLLRASKEIWWPCDVNPVPKMSKDCSHQGLDFVISDSKVWTSTLY
jgi:hypothetical protein